MLCMLNIVPDTETGSIQIISLFLRRLLSSLGFENTVCFACKDQYSLQTRKIYSPGV